MEITLKRKIVAGAAFTLGALTVGSTLYYTVEDETRELTHCTQTTCIGKVYGKTAIPPGRYEIRDTWSPRFKKNMLELMNVPGFTGIRIHSGSTADDSAGCLIIGLSQTPAGVAQSRAGVAQFNAQIRKMLATGERVFITIE